MTLADEDTNSILTDNANRAIQGNVAMHVTQPGGQQVTESSSGFVVPLAMFNTKWINYNGP